MTDGMEVGSSAAIRHSAVPSDPNAARAFLQSRVSIYVGVALALWGVALLGDMLIKAITLGDPIARPSGWYVHAHYAAVAVLSVLFALTRRRTRSVGALRTMEVFATLLQAVLSTVLLSQLPLAVRPEMLTLFAATLLLMLRAALVPGSALVAFVVGVLSMLPTIAFTLWLYSTQPMVPGSGMTFTTGVFYVLEWCGMALVATTSVHAVIYGLQERVHELGQYTLLHKIGEGGMGVVYRARHALLRRPTAVKVLPVERTSPSGIARFEREVQLTAELAHPNIVAVYDFGRTPDGAFYYAMELLTGVDLQRLVEDDGPLPAARAVHLLVQAADAIAEAHEVGLIHRDIKPANLLVSNRPRRPDHLTVLDFGLAKEISQADPGLSGVDAITGTPLYMAPESITDPASVDGRSDVYALGAVAYWLLTATTPFRGRTFIEICAGHLHEEPEAPSVRLGRALAPELDALVLACLAKQQRDRPDGTALLERLRALTLGGWSAADAKACWDARVARAADAPAESIEHARTMEIARRPDVA
jgi:serine/threonine-protein kinase